MSALDYARLSKAISAADASSIRERWLWGLRLLHDPQFITENGNLKHGAMDKLLHASRAMQIKLWDREVRNRLTCARAYPTEAQIGTVLDQFGSWFELVQAGFPDVPRPDGEPDAEWRTINERRRSGKRLLEEIEKRDRGEHPLFDLWRVVPDEYWDKTVADYNWYVTDQKRITDDFVDRQKRLETTRDLLVAATGGDESMTCADAFGRIP